jgi:ankyrin repeat protein
MSTHLNIGPVTGSEGAQNFVGVFHGPITIGQRQYPNRRLTRVIVCSPDLLLTYLLLGVVESIKQALFLSDPYVDRESLISKKGRRVAGTCEWITQHPSYQSWLQDDEQLLWISGGPGKGKTMMSIFLTEELERLAFASTGVQAVFYFCNIQDEKRNTALAILRSLIHQIITQTPDLAKHAQAYFTPDDQQRQTLTSFETLWMILRGIVTDKSLPTTFCVLDGLDESDEQALELLVPRLVDLLSADPSPNTASAFRLAIVSRDIHSLHGCVQVKLDPDHDEDVAHDIESFVSSMTEGLPAPEGSEITFRAHIQKTLLDRAKGTFLWVGFAMHELRKKRTSTEVLAALEDLPSGLENIYGAMLLQIPFDQRELSSKLLLWVTLALRPLSLIGLAAAADVRSSSTLITLEQAIRDAVELCAPLLQIKKEKVDPVWDQRSGSFMKVLDIERVHLIHASARDYLVRKVSDKNPTLEQFRINEEEAHLNIARTCLRYIISSELRHQAVFSMDTKDPQELSFLRYSAIHWYEHVRFCPTMANHLFHSFKPFFRRHSKVRNNWYRFRNYLDHWYLFRNDWFHRVEIVFVTPQLHMASEYGVIPWIRWVLQLPARIPTFRSRKNERDQTGMTSLCNAIFYGHEDAAKFLIGEGVNLFVKDSSWTAAIDSAIRQGWVEVVLLLIKPGTHSNGRKMPRFAIGIGTHINRRDYTGRTILHRAALFGQESIVRMLIENGADVKLTVTGHGTGLGDFGMATALHFAATNGNMEIVKILVASGAGVEATTKCGLTALHMAARKGNDEALRILIEHGADFKATDDDGWTVLHTAVGGGHTIVIRMLIDLGADIAAKATDGSTVLHQAMRTARNRVDRILLEHGANVKEKDVRGNTVLHVAARWRTKEAVRMLLEHGADIEAKNEDGNTALHVAADERDAGFVQALIDHGANIQAKNNYGETPRDLAIKSRWKKVIQLLDQAHTAQANKLQL